MVPREHGAWGILLPPLLTGAAVGMAAGGRTLPAFLFALAVVALFWAKDATRKLDGHCADESPVSAGTATGAANGFIASGRRCDCAGSTLLAGERVEAAMVRSSRRIAFTAQLVLKRSGRRTRMAAQMAGAFGLTSTAAAAYYVVTGRLDNTAYALWLSNWLFAGDQIHYVGLRIRAARTQRQHEKLAAGWISLPAEIVVAGILLIAWQRRLLPGLSLLAFIPVLLRGTLWFLRKPRPIVIRHLGWTELAHAAAFGALLVAGFCIR